MDSLDALFRSIDLVMDDVRRNRVTAEVAIVELLSLLRRLAVAVGQALAPTRGRCGREEVPMD